MNVPKPGRSSFRDAEISALLEDFFRNEMPAELRELPDATASRKNTMTADRSQAARSQTVRSRAGFVGIAAAACALVVTAAVLWFPSQTNRTSISSGSNASGPKPSGIIELSTDGPNTTSTGVEYSVTNQVDSVEKLTYETENGPVEQRTRLRTTNVSVFDPETGTQVELTIPELDIEIVPIEDE